LKKLISLIFLFPAIFFGMGCLLLYFLVYIRLYRNRSYSLQKVPGKSSAIANLKIAIVSKEYPPNKTHLSSFAEEFSKGLVALGHQVHVVTTGEEGSDLCSEGYWIHRIGSRTPTIFKYIKMAGFFEAGIHLEHGYLVSRCLVALNKVHKFNVIEFPEACAEGAFYYFMRSKPPFVARLHTSEGFGHQLSAQQFNLDRLWVRTMEKYWILKADALIGVSESIVRKYESFYHLDFKGVPIIPNPLGPEWFLAETSVPSGKALKVLFVGRFALSKGPHLLLQAIPKILEGSPHAEFIFIGVDSGLRKYCEDIVENSGIAPNVTFLEQAPRDQMIDHYRSATVCVFPSQWDSFSYACIEAMASGCAVVATDVGGFPEIIENGVSGLLAEAGDPDSLADAIVEVLTNDELRAKIRMNAPERIRSLCDAKQVAVRNLAIYREVINT